MDTNELEIGKEVYYHERWSKNCKIGKIIGETKKYWKIQFGDTSPDLFRKDNLRMRGSDIWNTINAYPLDDNKKEEIIHKALITALERKINNFLKVGMSLKNIETGEKILELADKIKELIKLDALQKDGE